ncbi:MAG TPA: hypothetical protein VFI97_09785 [Arthrobacter sp.]|nr:hypothetical protein [Arthrobacter sp.]
MEQDALPRLDEHAVDVRATRDEVWAALILTIGNSFAGAAGERLARLLGCEPKKVSGWSTPAAGSSLPGFMIRSMEQPRQVTLTGRHRFSEYALIFRIEEIAGLTRCKAESRAHFPGWRGRLYRRAVIGSGGHHLLMRRMLRRVKVLAEQAT